MGFLHKQIFKFVFCIFCEFVYFLVFKHQKMDEMKICDVRLSELYRTLWIVYMSLFHLLVIPGIGIAL